MVCRVRSLRLDTLLPSRFALQTGALGARRRAKLANQTCTTLKRGGGVGGQLPKGRGDEAGYATVAPQVVSPTPNGGEAGKRLYSLSSAAAI